MDAYKCYLSLGANLGDRLASLQQALDLLASSDEIQLVSISSMYETPPWGNVNQPAFINCTAAVKTKLEPVELLHICQGIEKALGRVRHEHWGARTIDIDLLFIEGVRINEAELVLPHPYMLERSFVLVPLAELVPDLLLSNGMTASQCMNTLPDKDDIKKL